jgi:hypothetical protein
MDAMIPSTVWRTHSCVPRSHSCERLVFPQERLALRELPTCEDQLRLHECRRCTQECVRHVRGVRYGVSRVSHEVQ